MPTYTPPSPCRSTRARQAQAAADQDTPACVYTGLKREQLPRTGSVVLHELYFAGLGGNGQAGSAVRSRISAAFGSYDSWETEFRKIATGLAGGSGWVMLGYNEALGMLKSHCMADHATAPAHTRPLLVHRRGARSHASAPLRSRSPASNG